MRKVITTVAFLGLCVFLIWSCGKLDENTVAKVGSETITLKDFEANLQRARMPKFNSAEEELNFKMEQLDKMIEEKLYVLAAYDEGYDKDSTIVEQLANLDERLMLRALFNEAIVKQVQITDEDLKAFYDEMGTEVKASHILVDTEEEANNLYKQLTEEGADFAMLASENSKDPRSAARGGDLGYFTKPDMVEEFSNAAFNLEVGAISKPVQSNYGWHIIKLFDKRSKKQKPFEEEKDMLKRQLENKMQRELSTKFLEDLYTENEVKLQEEGVNVLLNRSADDQTLLSDEDRAKPLVTFKTGTWTVGEFEMEIKKYSGRVPPFENEDMILNQVKRLLQPQLLNQKAIEMNIRESESYKDLYKESLEAEMVRNYRQKAIQGSIEITDDDMKAYYEEHPDEFQDKPMVNVREIQVDTKEEAQKLLDQLKGGADFAELAQEHTNRVYTKRKGGELGFFPQSRYPELFDAAWKLEPDELAGPIEMKGKFSIIQLIEKQDARIKPFNEVERKIKSVLQQDMMKTAKDRWIENTRKKYKVKINEDAVKATIDESSYTTPAPTPQNTPQAVQPGAKPEIKMKDAKELKKEQEGK
ncbi:peptidylprolyl isomerase [bacterium]|nr:peptidylprolyl isomerase [bacterium]